MHHVNAKGLHSSKHMASLDGSHGHDNLDFTLIALYIDPLRTSCMNYDAANTPHSHHRLFSVNLVEASTTPQISPSTCDQNQSNTNNATFSHITAASSVMAFPWIMWGQRIMGWGREPAWSKNKLRHVQALEILT